MKIIDKIKKELDKIKDNFNFDMSQKESEENIADIKIDINKAGKANVNISFIDNEKTRKWIDKADKIKGLVK